jgi:6-pyruvoyl-tetrahydropterin synthase
MSQNHTFSLFIKDFTHLDGAIYDPLKGPIGISYVLGIEFIGEQLADGTVFDFSAAKKLAKKVVDSTADHAFVVPIDSLEEAGNDYIFKDDFHYYRAPRQAFFPIHNANPNGLFAKLEELILEACKNDQECAKLKTVRLHPSEEKTDDENRYFYRYTHGLKDNKSNCQRLIHGHRSSIRIFVDDTRRLDLEKTICEKMTDKHFVWTQNSIVTDEDFLNDKKTLQYKSSQGVFYLNIHKNKTITMPYETTVENISRYLAECVREMIGDKHKIEAHAFEGIEKGSIYILHEKTSQHQNHSLYLKG